MTNIQATLERVRDGRLKVEHPYMIFVLTNHPNMLATGADWTYYTSIHDRDLAVQLADYIIDARQMFACVIQTPEVNPGAEDAWVSDNENV